MPTIFKRSSGWKWVPDSDEINSADGALLRADNTIPDELGARRLRRGSETLYSRLDGAVHSMYSAQLQGNMHRITGAGNSLYVNGEKQISGLAGTGDVSFCDDSYQVFVSRGTEKKKWDGETLNNWGVTRPDSAPTLTAIDSITYAACSFDSTESPAVVVNEQAGTGPPFTPVFVANHVLPITHADYSATGALSLTPHAGTGRASVSKKFAANTDMLNFLGNVGGQTDLFDIRVWIEEPRKVDKVTVMFGMSTGEDPFLDDYYYFDFNIRNTGTVDIKDAASNSAAAYGVSNDRLLSPLTPQEITRVKSPADAGKILRAIGRFAGSRSRERADVSSASPAWGHLSVTRGQFSRVGGTPGRDWKTVRGFKVIYTAIPGSTDKIYLEDAIWTGGGNRALTGSFQVGVRFARKFLDKHGAEIYTELSPMSAISQQIVLQQQTLQVRLAAATMNSKDSQVNQVWVYLYGGFLDTFYRVAILPAAPGGGLQLEDLTDPNNLDDPGELAVMNSFAFSETTNESEETPDLLAKIYKSELEALIENEVFEPGSVGPPDNIVAIAGPWNKRIFCLTRDGWLYPSSNKNPSSFSLYQTIDLRMYGEPLWAVKTSTGVVVGMSKDIILIAGSGDQSEDNQLADLYPQPLNIANPPVDSSVSIDGNSIYYRSCDGPMVFAGASAQSIPFAGTSMLWKGYDRYGVEKLDTINGRFRFEMDDHQLYMVAPEGNNPVATITYDNTILPVINNKVVIDDRVYRFKSDAVPVANGDVYIGTTADEAWTNMVAAINDDEAGVYKVASAHPKVTAAIDLGADVVTLTAATRSRMYLFSDCPSANESVFETPSTSVWKFYGNEWTRFTYGVNTVCSLHREYDGGLIAGTYEGNVLEIETGDLDSAQKIYVEMLTPFSDGDSPLTRKDPADFQLHGQTGGSTGTVNFFTDTSDFPLTPIKTLQYSLLADGIWRASLLGVLPFQKIQVEIFGSMSALSFHGLGISYTERPQHVMVLDLNNLIPGNNADLSWINQIEVDCSSDYNLYLDVYKNGLLHCTELVPVNPGVRDVYTIGPLPRDTKGRRLGIILRTSHADGEGAIGFETYAVRVRSGTTGNVTELELGSGDGRSDQ